MCSPSIFPALYIGGSFTSANGEEVYRTTIARNRSMEEVDKGVSNTVRFCLGFSLLGSK